MDSPLKAEFDYYRANQDALVKQYKGKFLVIKDQKVIAAYDDQVVAINETTKLYKLGSFLVQKVEPGDSAYSQTFHSRAAFH